MSFIPTDCTCCPTLDPDPDNILTCGPDGLLAIGGGSGGALVTQDSDCIDFSGAGTAGSPLTADPIIDPNPENILTCGASGLLALQSTTNGPEALVIAASDETTPITTGITKVTFRMPFAMTLTSVRASLTTASSSGTPTFDINESGVTVLSTKITIDVGEKTSTTAAIPPVISDSSLADDAEMTIDFDVAGTGATGVKIYLLGTRT